MNFIPYFLTRQKEMLDLLQGLVELESPSDNKAAVDRCSQHILNEFDTIGARAKHFPQAEIGDLHLIEYPGDKAKTQGNILVLAHVDTVWKVGTIKDRPFSIKQDKAFGPGVLDMKAGLVMIIQALRFISKHDRSPAKSIHVFLDSYEEQGSDAVYKKIRELAQTASLVLCLEPAIPGGALKLRRKGRLVARVRVEGKAAHAGSPESGISAVDELMVQLKILQRLRSNNISLNIGDISGGDTVNVVASHAEALLDIRFWTNSQAQRIRNALKELSPSLPGARIIPTIEQEMPPLEHGRPSAALFRKVTRIAQELNLELIGGRTGGGSDASVAALEGIPVLDGLGPDGDGIHAEHEHVLIPSLIERTALLTELLLRL